MKEGLDKNEIYQEVSGKVEKIEKLEDKEATNEKRVSKKKKEEYIKENN